VAAATSRLGGNTLSCLLFFVLGSLCAEMEMLQDSLLGLPALNEQYQVQNEAYDYFYDAVW
jgi:hypothetical protein